MHPEASLLDEVAAWESAAEYSASFFLLGAEGREEQLEELPANFLFSDSLRLRVRYMMSDDE